MTRMFIVNRTVASSIVLSIGMLIAVDACSGTGPTAAPPSTTPAPSVVASASGVVASPPAGSATPPASLPVASSEPLPSGCVSPPPDLATIVALDPAARLACFGQTSITFAATIFKPILDCGIGPQIEPAWFCFPGVFVAVPNAPPDSGLAALDAYWKPGSGLTAASFTIDKTVTITGHFDDPAAASCHITSQPAGQSQEPAADVVLACREAFVVTAVH